MFNTTSNLWTWISGPNTIESTETDFPMYRKHASTWTDSEMVFWIYGGNMADGCMNFG